MNKNQQLGILGTVLVLVVVAVMVFVGGKDSGDTTIQEKPLTEEPSSLPPYPIPNGYALLLQAADHVKPVPGTVAEMSRAHKEIFVSDHEVALDLLDEALDVEARVILSGPEVTGESRKESIGDLHRLADLVEMQASWFESVVKPSEAGQAYLKLIRLASRVARGGQLEDWTASLVTYQKAVEGAGRILPRLSPEALLNFREGLATIHERAVDANQLKKWAQALKGSGTGLSLGSQADAESAWEKLEMAQEEQVLSLRKLFLHAGMRAYEFKLGQPPKTLAALVPEFCSQIPLNPLTEEPLTLLDLTVAEELSDSDASEDSTAID